MTIEEIGAAEFGSRRRVSNYFVPFRPVRTIRPSPIKMGPVKRMLPRSPVQMSVPRVRQTPRTVRRYALPTMARPQLNIRAFPLQAFSRRGGQATVLRGINEIMAMEF